MINIKYTLTILGVILISALSLFLAALPEMNQVGRVMFSFFGVSGFAMIITYMSWRINSSKRKSTQQKIENRGPVRRNPNVYYRKKVA